MKVILKKSPNMFAPIIKRSKWRCLPKAVLVEEGMLITMISNERYTAPD
ncbi:hypothetical protein J7E52_06030 [Bacillus sp. ISL-34]|nr:hypothetical protein [Bacillus sp. ISL-34]MBT2646294.1 hypothetical protein [Bacillus sp. ISL-34]